MTYRGEISTVLPPVMLTQTFPDETLEQYMPFHMQETGLCCYVGTYGNT